ncbi:MAG: nitrous oxide reductase family maturation protein NosD [candidate division WOR-3 bacterium]|jgi:nitrous oxidase accessory protein
MDILVCSECFFKDIQSAINFSKGGEKIIVKSGIYKAPIFINKSIELIAQGKVIIDGGGKYQIITVMADDVKIEGFIIKNSGMSYSEDIAGLKVKNSRNCTIKNNHLINNFFAIYLEGVNNCKIENNIIIGFARGEGSSGNGIHIWNSESIFIKKNYIKGHRDGIYFEFVKNSIIMENVSEDNLRYGLHFMFSHNNVFIKNKFHRNGAGVAVMYSKNVMIEENIFNENRGLASYGFLLKDLSDSKVYKNQFINNTYGVYLEECNRTIFKENLFKNNGWAIRIYANSENNLFERNIFIGNAFDVSTNNITYFQNTFLKNYWDKYQGYDLDKDGIGDIPYRPVSFMSFLFEKYPLSILFYNSFLMYIMDIMESLIPLFNPKSLIDKEPLTKPL